MVRITGSVSEENSLTAPTGELFSSVVRRSSGKSAKRISGTESSPPTKTEPTPNKAPRKERLFSRDDPGAEGCSVIAAESPARAHIEFSLLTNCSMIREPDGRAPKLAGPPSSLFLLRQFPDVRDQRFDRIRRQFLSKGGHFPHAFGDDLGELRIGFSLHFRRPQIFGLQGLA